MSKKHQLIDFLNQRTLTFTVNEVIQIIAIIASLEEGKQEETNKPNKK